MHLLILGCGKTGSLVAEVARERRHHVQAMSSSDNPAASALTPQALKAIDVVIDFTTPQAVLANVEACAKAGKNMVVGTTGWYDQMDWVHNIVSECKTGFLYAANFSIGVNL